MIEMKLLTEILTETDIENKRMITKADGMGWEIDRTLELTQTYYYIKEGKERGPTVVHWELHLVSFFFSFIFISWRLITL